MPEYSVSEVSGALKRTVEDAFGFVRVRGELSGVKRAASGHIYMALKDDNAVLDGVCWRGVASKLTFRPEDGLEVICTGKLTTYPGRSKYQMVVERMEPAGVGALMQLLEERKRKLAAEGLFAAERKRAIPFLPEVIGVVTSPTGAVIRDIMHRLRDRFPRHVLVWPVLVQGEGAAEQVARAIRGFNSLAADGPIPRPDTLIIARGGGSIEDLWAFNEEVVVRAAAESQIPLISAVGHETDTTLIDHASDKRAPTPTAAAEMAVPVKAELTAYVVDCRRRLDAATLRLVQERRTRLEGLARGLRNPQEVINQASQRLDDFAERLKLATLNNVERRKGRLNELAAALRPAGLRKDIDNSKQRLITLDERLVRSFKRQMEDKQNRLTQAGRLLESSSYQRTLDRGFALVLDGAGKPVTSAKAVASGDALTIRLKDGDIGAFAGEPGSAPAPTPVPASPAAAEPEAPAPKPKPKPKPKKKTPAPNPEQGSLF